MCRKSDSFTFKLSPEQRERMEKIAGRLDVPMAEICRDGLEVYLDALDYEMNTGRSAGYSYDSGWMSCPEPEEPFCKDCGEHHTATAFCQARWEWAQNSN